MNSESLIHGAEHGTDQRTHYGAEHRRNQRSVHRPGPGLPSAQGPAQGAALDAAQGPVTPPRRQPLRRHRRRPPGLPLILLGLSATLLAGCDTPPSRLEANFGSSVRQALALQTAPANAPLPAQDGVKAEAALRRYRSSGDATMPDASGLWIPFGD